MTLEEILDCDSAKLRAMSNEQLLVWFEPILNVTRPERCVRQSRDTGKTPVIMTPELKKGMAIASELGIDLSYLHSVKRKKK